MTILIFKFITIHYVIQYNFIIFNGFLAIISDSNALILKYKLNTIHYYWLIKSFKL